tara:strand:- start:8681 stop:8926 length:246 start_codon:yes stop_codon:yes gene_type:complete
MSSAKYNLLREPLIISKSKYMTRHGKKCFYEILNNRKKLCFTILFESQKEAEKYLKENHKDKKYIIDELIIDEKEANEENG